MQTDGNQPVEMEYIPTGIQGLDDLLNQEGIACPENDGFLGLILGSAGTGKSILALEMCCRFAEENSKKPDNAGNSQKRCAIYLSREPFQVVSKKIINGFNYFHSETDKKPDLVEEIGLLKPGGVFIAHLGYGYEDQEGLLRNIFDRARQITAGKSGPDVLVCIDSANIIREAAMAKVFYSQKEETPQVDLLSRDRLLDAYNADFFLRLHDNIARRRVHTFLVLEEKGGGNALISTRADVYAADIVIQLGIRNYPIQYRERVLEIIKAKNQYYYRGQHHFSIVGQTGKMGGTGGRLGEKERGIVIYPSVATQLSKLARDKEKYSLEDKIGFTLGISDLDTKIQQEIQSVKDQGYIRYGTNSVLVSDLDIKATEIGLHFAMGAPCGALYLSLMHKEEDLIETAERFYGDIAERLEAELPNGQPKIKLCYLPPEHISEHKLLRDIDELIKANRSEMRKTSDGKRILSQYAVVLDNVFELQCKYPMLGDVRHFLAALFELFRIRRVTALVVDTVEAGESRNPLEQSFVAGLADNVFLLRHVEFRSRPHRVFSVLKLVGGGTPDTLWDLDEEIEKDGKGITKLVARDTFALCKNVLSGKPEPINIRITLYQDEKGSPFDQYLTTRKDLLRQHFGQNVKIELYGAEAHAKVQSLLTLPGAPQFVDCQIVALDEFWLHRLIKEKRLEDLSTYFPKDDPEWDWTQYVSAAHDIALYQNKPENTKEWKAWFSQRFAVPARNNCGILCFQPTLVKQVFAGSSCESIVKRLVKDSQARSISWDDLLKLKKEYQRILECKPVGEDYPEVFFTFCMDQIESCVCFLIETILGTVKPRRDIRYILDILKRPDSVKQQRRFVIGRKIARGIRRIFELLGKDDIALLSQGRFRTFEEEPRALFCRQWMSTLGCLKEIGKKEYRNYFRTLEPFELPIGKSESALPVSGTWYLGILKGSIAVKTGVELIKQFTSITDEIYKLDHCIGMPVRKRFYDSGLGAVFRLPYAEVYSEIAKVQKSFLSDPANSDESNRYIQVVHTGEKMFYRTLIDNYPLGSAVLWRMLVRTAKEFLASGGNMGGGLEKYINLVATAANEMIALREGDKRV
ncbi:MAG: hypothetical protein GX455_09800 [Phycisphaerae bacterium]|nr:hypothetical protein [Phycisphaerae bacterium]